MWGSVGKMLIDRIAHGEGDLNSHGQHSPERKVTQKSNLLLARDRHLGKENFTDNSVTALSLWLLLNGQRVERISRFHTNRGKARQNYRLGTVNIGTLVARSHETVELLVWRWVDTCCLKEVHHRNQGIGDSSLFTGELHFWRCVNTNNVNRS